MTQFCNIFRFFFRKCNLCSSFVQPMTSLFFLLLILSLPPFWKRVNACRPAGSRWGQRGSTCSDETRCLWVWWWFHRERYVTSAQQLYRCVLHVEWVHRSLRLIALFQHVKSKSPFVPDDGQRAWNTLFYYFNTFKPLSAGSLSVWRLVRFHRELPV